MHGNHAFLKILIDEMTMMKHTIHERLLILLCHLYFVNVASLITPYLQLQNVATNLRSTKSTTSSETPITPITPSPVEKKERLKFVVNIHATSDPMENVTIHELGQFLSTKVCRNVFLSAGGKSSRCVDIEPITDELEQMWNMECQSHYGPTMLLEYGDALVESESVVQFPGLKMVNIVYSGVKARVKDNIPYYDVILVGERKQVFGAPPIVWLFNALTGHSSEKEGVLQSPSARVQSTISVIEPEVLGPCFCFDCKVEIVVEFPKAMMKILPISKEKMEEQGTASVKKAIEKDILSALERVNKVYLERVSADQSMTE